MKAKSKRLPKAAAQSEPPGKGSRKSTCFKMVQPVRCPQKPVATGDSLAFCMMLHQIIVLVDSNGHGHSLRHADLEILPAHPEPPGTDFILKRIHGARGRAGSALAFGVEDPTVAGANELRLLGVPVDGATQVRAYGR